MVSNNDGMVAGTKPFNEYMLVSYLAMAEEKTGTNALGQVQNFYFQLGFNLGMTQTVRVSKLNNLNQI